jgi:hypothetical protein
VRTGGAGATIGASVSPNCRNFVCTPNPDCVSGLWTVPGTWTSVTGENPVNGYGLRAGSQGAMLLFQQDARCGDMQVELAMSPEKTEGTGFGSPGGPQDGERIQKSDILEPASRGLGPRPAETAMSTASSRFPIQAGFRPRRG